MPTTAVSTTSRRDAFWFLCHDVINIFVLLILIGLHHADSRWVTGDYMTGKFLHLLGFAWFFGGLIFASFAISRYVWSQASLDHLRLADGYRFILQLEFWCIPSIALIAYGGMMMVTQIGGLEVNGWASQAYGFLLATPPILMITTRFFHKRFIQDATLNIARQKLTAFWQDWLFIIVMILMMVALTFSMLQKTPLFG
jgi:hypothetical protein